jgi:hypothetical protein
MGNMNTKTISILFLLMLITLSLSLQACQDAPNTLRVTSLEITPANILVGEKTSVKAEVMNDYGSMKKYDIPLMVNGVADNRKYVTLAPGGTETIEFSLRRDEAGVYTVRIGEQQSILEVRQPMPAKFKLSKLEINPAEPDVNGEIVIKADIANIGEVKGKYTAELKINNVVTKTDETVILPGASSFFVFKVSQGSPGTYMVNIGELAGQFTVVASIMPVQISPPCPPETKWDPKKKC